jgi:Fe-S oxidoreductase
MALSRRFLSMANLGVHFWMHMLAKPFVSGQSRGRKRYDRNYAADRLIPFTHEEFERLEAYERCLNCGLCDAACLQARGLGLGLWAVEGRKDKPDFRYAPGLVPAGISRSQPQFHAGVELAAMLEACRDCRRCEQSCPGSVPVLEIGALVVRRAAHMERLPAKAV